MAWAIMLLYDVYIQWDGTGLFRVPSPPEEYIRHDTSFAVCRLRERMRSAKWYK